VRFAVCKIATLTLLGLALIDPALADPPVAESNITADSFKCIRDMQPVRGFYVDNLGSDLAGTLAVANSPKGVRTRPAPSSSWYRAK
jgi:hypothetical protein